MKRLYTTILLLLIIITCSKQEQNFTSEQSSMIKSADTLAPMRVFTIADKADSLLLRTNSEDIIPNKKDEILKTLIKRMYATVQDSATQGLGIAAPQVGILKNIIWVQRFDKDGEPFEYYLNPKILKYSELKQDCREGCLSVPDIRDTTATRSYAILLEYDKLDKTHHTEMIEDFTAVIFQHEIDHLNGVIFLDRLDEK